MGGVLEIWRYPLKSAGGEQLAAVDVGVDGVVGDRVWGCLDEDGVVVSAKQPRLWERMLKVSVAGEVARLPGGRAVRLDAAEADEVLSDWLGRKVRVTTTVPVGAVLRRFWPREAGMIPDWAGGAEPGGDAVTAIGSGRFVDFGAVHLVTTGALGVLKQRHGRAVDHRRFRPNLLVDLPGEPAPGDLVRVGAEVVLRVEVPTPRCVIPSLDHHDGVERGLLSTLAREYRMKVGQFGTAACFGWYASVVRPGRVARGDSIG